MKIIKLLKHPNHFVFNARRIHKCRKMNNINNPDKIKHLILLTDLMDTLENNLSQFNRICYIYLKTIIIIQLISNSAQAI